MNYLGLNLKPVLGMGTRSHPFSHQITHYSSSFHPSLSYLTTFPSLLGHSWKHKASCYFSTSLPLLTNSTLYWSTLPNSLIYFLCNKSPQKNYLYSLFLMSLSLLFLQQAPSRLWSLTIPLKLHSSLLTLLCWIQWVIRRSPFTAAIHTQHLA